MKLFSDNGFIDVYDSCLSSGQMEKDSSSRPRRPSCDVKVCKGYVFYTLLAAVPGVARDIFETLKKNRNFKTNLNLKKKRILKKKF